MGHFEKVTPLGRRYVLKKIKGPAGKEEAGKIQQDQRGASCSHLQSQDSGKAS